MRARLALVRVPSVFGRDHPWLDRPIQPTDKDALDSGCIRKRVGPPRIRATKNGPPSCNRCSHCQSPHRRTGCLRRRAPSASLTPRYPLARPERRRRAQSRTQLANRYALQTVLATPKDQPDQPRRWRPKPNIPRRIASDLTVSGVSVTPALPVIVLTSPASFASGLFRPCVLPSLIAHRGVLRTTPHSRD